MTEPLSAGAGAILDLVAPRLCMVCGCTLTYGEEWLCTGCLLTLPRTGMHLQPTNRLSDRMLRHIAVCRAASWFFYRRESPYTEIIYKLKYRQMPAAGQWLGRTYAAEVMSSGLFDDVDLIVPVPLHWLKKLRRGYNQSQEIALGISEATGIPVGCDVLKARGHAQQKSKSRIQRTVDMLDGVFWLNDAGAIAGRHVLVVDDVATTGATLEACVMALMSARIAPRAISLMTLGATEND